jgi:alpha-tubulin suppressor-like RCC1 family protein
MFAVGIATSIGCKSVVTEKQAIPEILVCCVADDRRWLTLLRQHSKALRGRDAVTLWEAGDIQPGERTEDAIAAAWARARAVLLLVGPGLLAEDFAPGSAVHTAVLAARGRGASLLWLPVSFSAYRATELADVEPLCDPQRPLDSLNPSEVHQVLVQVCDRIATAVHGRPVTVARMQVPRVGLLVAAGLSVIAVPITCGLAKSWFGGEEDMSQDPVEQPRLAAPPSVPKPDPTTKPVDPPSVQPTPTLTPEAIAKLIAASAVNDCRAAGGCIVQVQGPEIQSIVAGGNHNCIVYTDGTLSCWGYPTGLGYGDVSARPWPRDAIIVPEFVDAGGTVKEVAIGTNHTCVLMVLHDRVRCWGGNGNGELGYGPMQQVGDEPGELPTPNLALGSPVEHIASNDRHTCAILDDGTVKCWGYNGSGQLGYPGGNVGDEDDEMPPAAARGVSNALQVVAGERHTCVLLQGGTVRCWGGNSSGELGDGTDRDSFDTWADRTERIPPDLELGGTVEELTAGANHTCARMAGGTVRCWGLNLHGQLGYEDRSRVGNIGDVPEEMPPKDVMIGGEAVQISAGAAHTCALLTDKTVRCWGHWMDAQLGYGLEQQRKDKLPPEPVPVGGEVERIVSSGGHFTCVRLTDGTLRCWGSM